MTRTNVPGSQTCDCGLIVTWMTMTVQRLTYSHHMLHVPPSLTSHLPESLIKAAKADIPSACKDTTAGYRWLQPAHWSRVDDFSNEFFPLKIPLENLTKLNLYIYEDITKVNWKLFMKHLYVNGLGLL